MKLIDKYILKKFLVTFIFVVGALVLIIVTIDYTEKNDKFLKADLTWQEILRYYLAFIPWVANLIMPITIFIASVLVTTTMAGKSELVAILSSGISFRRMLLPFLIGASMISVTSFYVNGWLIPNSNKFKIAFEVEYLKKPFYFSERDIHVGINKDAYLYLERYNNRSKTAYKVTLERMEGLKLVEKLSSKKMSWNDSSKKWLFKDWQLIEINDFGETVTWGEKLDTLINLTPKDFETKYGLYETMNFNELYDHIELLNTRGSKEVGEYEIEKYVRFMLPFTTLILTFMGVFVSAEKNTRGGAGFKIALGFMIAFVFIIMFVLVKAIAEAGTMNPMIAIWIPNFVGLVATGVLYYLVPK